MKLIVFLAVAGILLASTHAAEDVEIKAQDGEEVKEEKSWLERMKEKYAEEIKAVMDRLKVIAKEAIDEAGAAALETGKGGLIELLIRNGVDATLGGLGKRSLDLEGIENAIKEKIKAVKDKYAEKVAGIMATLGDFKGLAGKAFRDAALELLAEKAAESTWAALGKRDAEEDVQKSWWERMKEKYADQIKAVLDRLKVLAKEAIDEAGAAAIEKGKEGFKELKEKQSGKAVEKRDIDLQKIEEDIKAKIEALKEKYGQKVEKVLEMMGGMKEFISTTFKQAALELLAERAAKSTWDILGKRDLERRGLKEIASASLEKLKSMAAKTKCEYWTIKAYMCILNPPNCTAEVAKMINSNEPLPGC